MFKLAVGRLPETGQRWPQPTMSRLENAPSKIETARMMAAMVDLFCESYPRPPRAITLDIDDTLDRAHGHQQLSFFNAHYDERCFLPIHVYQAASGKPVAAILRAGGTPSGEEVRAVIKHVTRRIRRHWPRTRICWRGDSHYARPEAMDWARRMASIMSSGSPAMTCCTPWSAASPTISACAAPRLARRSVGPGRPSTTPPRAGPTRAVIARLEATAQGFDARYIVTTIAGSARHPYETVYCARGQAENFIKLHKSQLASDRTSCRSPNANQFRLILHTAAYWLLHTLRAAAPKRSCWKTAEFTTLRLRLLKIAARVIEGAARIRVCLPTACPDAAIFRMLAGRFAVAGP